LAAVFLFCLAILVWKHNFGEKSILGKKNLLYLEWPIPIFGLISPTVFLPESCRPSHISTPFKLINQVTYQFTIYVDKLGRFISFLL